MPLIQVTMLMGRTIEQKRKIAARITDAMVEDAKAAKEAVVVTFIEITREDYASAGVLLADKVVSAFFAMSICPTQTSCGLRPAFLSAWPQKH
jgi:4-oxalocrotonate tautomerase